MYGLTPQIPAGCRWNGAPTGPQPTPSPTGQMKNVEPEEGSPALVCHSSWRSLDKTLGPLWASGLPSVKWQKRVLVS